MIATEESCERRILAALRRIVHSIDLHSRRLLAECEVTAPQLVCLHMLDNEGPLTSRALAGKVHVNPSTLVGILDRLEAKGLVLRRRDPEDRRSVFVELTRAGAAFVAKAPSPLQAALVGRLRRLSRKEQRKLAQSLEEVVGLMQAEALDEVPVLTSSRFGGSRNLGPRSLGSQSPRT
jgi:DNA-binding MarR family transcriptional regulator